MIANSGHDERGKYSGGVAGDQTGTEWEIRKWYKYSHGWNCVLRYPDIAVGQKIADLARAAANNNKIGYNQANRLSFWRALEKANYDPAEITTSCDSDCSAGVTAIVKAVGYIMDLPKLKELAITNYTGSMKANFRAVGFMVLTDEKYLTSDKYLLPGDILLNERHHTCINLDYGEKVKPQTGWIKDAVGWWYRNEDGSYPKDEWVNIDGNDYCFDASGYLLTDQYIKSANYDTNKKLYYVDKDGKWDGKTYRWEKDDKGWWLAEVGGSWFPKSAWCLIDGKWYYFNAKGYMVTGKRKIGDKEYVFNDDGSLVE
jgi:hypothetical protein